MDLAATMTAGPGAPAGRRPTQRRTRAGHALVIGPIALGLCVAAAGGATAAQVPPSVLAPSVCDVIGEAAALHHLPIDYFSKLIWRESRFHHDAQSPVGAQGIAQFMPRTAAERGLADPFAVREALLHSAGYLEELRATFGNLGLAAAGYNAGPGRVTRWLAGQAELPQETLDYVAAITGHGADEWRATPAPALATDKDFSCARYAVLAARSREPAHVAGSVTSPSRPWAVILLGSPARDKVMSEYRMVRGQFSGILGGIEPNVVHKRISGMQMPRYIVQIERDTRGAADALCSRLQRAGGACFVLANRG